MTLQILLWLVAVQGCGFAALPVGLRLFRAFPDGGYAFSKPLGLLLVTYVVWLLGMLQYVEYRAATVLIVLAILAATVWWRWGGEAIVWLRARRAVVALEEAIFLVAVLIGAGVRAFNADI